MTGEAIARRTAAVRIARFALLPAAALGMPVAAVRASAAGSNPVGSYRLTRSLTRTLSDGATIVVIRSWAIRIGRAPDGFTVEGHQLSAEVNAPPVLAALAAIERSRDASELFPITLDAHGMILHTGDVSAGPLLARSIDTAKALFGSLPARAGREDARSFAANLVRISAAAVSEVPRDLFFPQPGTQTVRRTIALPDGSEGAIIVTASASVAGPGGLLAASERRVVTVLEGSERMASERWELVQQ